MARDRHAVPEPLEHVHGGTRRLRMEVIVERVRPQQNRPLADVPRRPAPEPRAKRRAGETRDLTLRMHPHDGLRDDG